MSEPIQSISQGNYILQGTVATSAGIVGDGSTQNPLRADETVLWDGSGTGAGYNTEISLSAPTSAFETVKFYWAGENGSTEATYRINEFAITDTKELPLDGLWQRYSDSKFNFVGCVVSANSDLTKYKISHTYRYNLSTSVIDIARDQSNFAYIHKIVGINRIANN